MLRDQLLDTVGFVACKPNILGKLNWVQPKLGDVPIAFHVDMHRLRAIRTEEHETVRANPENCRHRTISRIRNDCLATLFESSYGTVAATDAVHRCVVHTLAF
jgi:hypothetical protein